MEVRAANWTSPHHFRIPHHLRRLRALALSGSPGRLCSIRWLGVGGTLRQCNSLFDSNPQSRPAPVGEEAPNRGRVTVATVSPPPLRSVSSPPC